MWAQRMASSGPLNSKKSQGGSPTSWCHLQRIHAPTAPARSSRRVVRPEAGTAPGRPPSPSCCCAARGRASVAKSSFELMEARIRERDPFRASPRRGGIQWFRSLYFGGRSSSPLIDRERRRLTAWATARNRGARCRPCPPDGVTVEARPHGLADPARRGHAGSLRQRAYAPVLLAREADRNAFDARPGSARPVGYSPARHVIVISHSARPHPQAIASGRGATPPARNGLDCLRAFLCQARRP